MKIKFKFTIKADKDGNLKITVYPTSEKGGKIEETFRLNAGDDLEYEKTVTVKALERSK